MQMLQLFSVAEGQQDVEGLAILSYFILGYFRNDEDNLVNLSLVE